MTFRKYGTLVCLTSALLATAASSEVVYRATPQVFVTPSGPPISSEGLEKMTLSAPSAASLAYGASWNFAFTAAGGRAPYTYDLTSGTLPAGISASRTPGLVLVGRTTAGSYGPFVVKVTDRDGRSETAASGVVTVGAAAPLALASASSSYRFQKDAPWSVPFAASGGLAPYTFSVPVGLTADVDPASGVTVRGAGIVGRYSIPSIAIADLVGVSGSSSIVSVTVGNEATLSASALSGLNVSGAGSVAKNLTVTNNGDFPGAQTPSGIVTGPFVQTGTTCTGALVAGASCDIALEGRATANGSLTGSYVIAGGPTVALSGTASGLASTVVMNPTTATVSTAGAPTGAPVNFSVKNGGTAVSGIATTTFTAASGFQIVSDACVGTSVAPNASCVISVARTATADEASKSGSLTVTFPNGGTATATFSGTATGLSPTAAMTPSAATASINGTTSPGPATIFEVENTGYGTSGAVTASFVAPTTEFAIQTGGTCGASSNLSHGQKCTILVSRTGATNDATSRTASIKATFATGASFATSTVSGTIANIQIGTCSSSTPAGSFCTADGRTLVMLNTGMLADSCDATMTRSGSTCTGPSATYAWSTNNPRTFLGTSNTGPINTTAMTTAPNVGKYPPATLCRSLGAKWFLPQHATIANMADAMPENAMIRSRLYWTSTENGKDYAFTNKLNASGGGGVGANTLKDDAVTGYVRCFREP